MNESCDPDKEDAWHNGFWTITQEELERFTKSIIKECMYLADLPKNASGQWKHLESSEVISKHFKI